MNFYSLIEAQRQACTDLTNEEVGMLPLTAKKAEGGKAKKFLILNWGEAPKVLAGS